MESNQNLLLIGSSNHTSNIMWCWDEISSLVIREEFDLLIRVITLHLFFMVIVFSKVEYWTVAHGGNKGLDFCSTLVTFPSTHRDIALFYVFSLNTCWWYISIELGANRNSTVIYAWMNLSDMCIFSIRDITTFLRLVDSYYICQANIIKKHKKDVKCVVLNKLQKRHQFRTKTTTPAGKAHVDEPEKCF